MTDWITKFISYFRKEKVIVARHRHPDNIRRKRTESIRDKLEV